ncbi:iron-sulfur cluster assembly enzyme ISCU, mitochondrial [Terrapene carolina triunguis]|uniref:iron-sulfur cluster assembly enzyme ISCU, mitochondrial n=1 Tax=Terrapene triunguis TaxID=2587831 RepID=UPI000E7746AF|nr:iron-sulfur cluster assembly enzyme ISCU, mitochondrial [Terrapene carolina triunguis]
MAALRMTGGRAAAAALLRPGPMGLAGPTAGYHKKVYKFQVDEALKIRNTDIAKELCLPPVKLHCSMLAEDAIRAALADYKLKQDPKKEGPEKKADKA